jgi:hypothetical protein
LHFRVILSAAKDLVLGDSSACGLRMTWEDEFLPLVFPKNNLRVAQQFRLAFGRRIF